jgi:hypothetical protein
LYKNKRKEIYYSTNNSDFKIPIVNYYFNNYIIFGDNDFKEEIEDIKKVLAKAKLSSQIGVSEFEMKEFKLTKIDLKRKETVYFVHKKEYPKKFKGMAEENKFFINACEKYSFDGKVILEEGAELKIRNSIVFQNSRTYFDGKWQTIRAFLDEYRNSPYEIISAVLKYNGDYCIIIENDEDEFYLHKLDLSKEIENNGSTNLLSKKEVFNMILNCKQVNYISPLLLMEFK